MLATELEAGVTAAFAEWRPKLAYPAERADVLRAVALLRNILQDATAELIGMAAAWLELKQFTADEDDFGNFIAHELATNSLTGMKQWINAQDPTGSQGMWVGAGIAKPVDPGDFVAAQKAWGGTLITGLLQQQAGLINEVIAGGIKDGLAREQITHRLLREAPSALMPEWRARLIAQTEVIRSMNAINHQNAVKAGADYLQWLDGQPAACPSCKKLNGQVIPLAPGLPPGQQAYFYDPLRGFTIQHPPCHPGCRCSVASATLEDYINQADFDGTSIVYPNSPAPSALPPPPKANEPTPLLDNYVPKFKGASDIAISDFLANMDFAEYQALAKELGTVKFLDTVKALKAKIAQKAQQESFQDLLDAASKAVSATPPPQGAPPLIASVYPATAAGKFKQWLDESGIDVANTPGLKLLQTYAKQAGLHFQNTSKALKTEGYEVKHLVAAPKGTFPEPNGKVKLPGAKTPKPAAAVQGLKDAPDAGGKGMPADDAPYWNGLKQVTGPKGSNPGGIYEGADGRQYYIKQYRNIQQADAEIAAHKVYDLVGIGTPNAKIVMMNGARVYASELIAGATAMTPAEMRKWVKANPELAARLHIASALTQNYDVIGLSYDNLMKLPNGKVVVVDTGGSWIFRAQGVIKTYSSDAGGFDSLLNKTQNKQTADVFGDLYKNERAVKSAQEAVKHLQTRIAQYGPDAIKAMNGGSIATIESKLKEMGLKLDVLEKRARQSTTSFGDFVASHDLDLLRQMGAKLAADTTIRVNPRGDSMIAGSWASSSTSTVGKYVNAMLGSHFYGLAPEQAFIHEMRTRRSTRTDDELRSDWAQVQHTAERRGITLEGMLATYRETQEELRKQHPSGRITLHRGMYEGSDGFIKDLKDALDRGDPAMFRPNWVASYSTSRPTAEGFSRLGGQRWSAVVSVEVPIEMIWATKDWLKKNGSSYNEHEYITLGMPSGFTLGYNNVSIWENGTKKYAEEDALPAPPLRPGDAQPHEFIIPPEFLSWMSDPELPGYHQAEKQEQKP